MHSCTTLLRMQTGESGRPQHRKHICTDSQITRSNLNKYLWMASRCTCFPLPARVGELARVVAQRGCDRGLHQHLTCWTNRCTRQCYKCVQHLYVNVNVNVYNMCCSPYITGPDPGISSRLMHVAHNSALRVYSVPVGGGVNVLAIVDTAM